MCPTSDLKAFGSNPNTPSDHTSAPACVPSNRMAQAAYEHARQHLHPLILDHSFRVYLYMIALSQLEGGEWHDASRLPILFTAAMYHDMGSADACDGPQRFEVEGADAVVAFLTSHGVSSTEAREVWIAIACHTSAGIGERISSLGRLVRLGPLVDFKRPDVLAMIDQATVQKTEEAFPRGDIAKVLSDTVVEQALRQRTKAPAATWPGGLLRFRDANPDWKGLNKEF